MAKSVEEVKRESDRFKRTSHNATIRKAIKNASRVDSLRDLEYVERLIQNGKNSMYYYGGFVLEPDVEQGLEELRKNCILQLRQKVKQEKEAYQTRIDNGEPTEKLEWLNKQCVMHSSHADSIQRVLDLIEETRRNQALQEEAKRKKKAERSAKLRTNVKKYVLPAIAILIVLVVLFIILNKFVIQPIIYEKNFERFKVQYEENLEEIKEEYSLKVDRIEYSELVPDYDLDYWETERINEYQVYVYINGEAPEPEKIYEIIQDINWANIGYLLSNTYEFLDDGEYVKDDTKETGFHQVNTLLIFNDGSEYKKDYIVLYKDGERIWKKESTYKPPSSSGVDNAPAGECNYPECDHNRASGKYYCHQHCCNEPGCSNSTGLLPSYCDNHNCTYPNCSAPKYGAVGSDYCQRHYIENN